MEPSSSSASATGTGSGADQSEGELRRMSTDFHELSRLVAARSMATTGTTPTSTTKAMASTNASVCNSASVVRSVAATTMADHDDEEDSWEEYDDEPIVLHKGDKARADRRKVIDNTTPTLEDEDRHHHQQQDRNVHVHGHTNGQPQRHQQQYPISHRGLEEEEEDDVEEEMISLEQERIRRARSTMASSATASSRSSTIINTSSTTGKHLHRDDDDQSLRRTPGAIQMHHSSRTELLGFGLALTTPLAGGGHGRDRQSPSTRPPRDPNTMNTNLSQQQNRREDSYTPASYALTKNPHIQVSHGAFSPNTLRLTEDLDNLLDEEDEELRHQFFQESDNAETSWTKQYIFESEGGTAEPTRFGRKNRRPSGRRSRGSNESPRECTPRQDQPQHLLFDQQLPHHLRRQDGMRSNDDEVPQPLNFGGAFSPPSDHGIFQRPVPSSAPNDPPFRLPIPSSAQNEQNAFSTSSKSFVPPHQTFNPSVFAPHPHVHHHPHDHPHGGYSLPSPTQMSNHPGTTTSMGAGLPHLGYDQRSHRMASSFVPPSNFMQTQQHHHQQYPQQQQQHPPHGVEWASVIMPSNNPNKYGNPYANHMPLPSPFGLHSQHQQQQQHQQQHHGGWGQDMETPWMDNNAFGYGISPHQSRMPSNPHPYAQPNLHVYAQPPVQQHHQQQHHQPPVYWNDAHNRGYEARSSPTAQFEPSPQETASFRFDSREGPFDDVDPSRANRCETRTALKRTIKKQVKTVGISNKVDKQLPRNVNKKIPTVPSSTLSPSNAKVAPVLPAVVAVTSKRIVKGRKTEEEHDDPGETKRAELVESPETRAAFKEFYRNFRLNERSSIQEAKDYALKALEGGSVPLKTHWRVYLELADLAKRSNRFGEARMLYAQVCELQPYASQGWLEFSKLEEECGHMSRCSKILNEGLKYCSINENLLSRAIKHEEKMNNLSRARELLARLKHVGIEKVWRTVLEGALLEGRAGNHIMARRVLKYLMHHVPWYGPLYLEAYRLERDLGRPDEALSIVEKGLKAIPRYGPLWFGAFRLCEALDFNEKAYHLPRTMLMFERAVNSISRELVWKVHLDAAQILERAALSSVAGMPDASIDHALDVCRKRVAMTALSCPSNLSWKVWLAGGRMELSAGNIDVARSLFLRAHKVVPEKGRVATLLECARLEEFAGDMDLARAILCKSRLEHSSDWKVWLESVLLEIRDGKHAKALSLAKQALEKHSGTGRLWACLVQLRYLEGGEGGQFVSLTNALRSVPKSGEVWCEGGRVHLNPFSKLFNLSEARRHLFFATRFTPQYGDGFLEALRLEMIERCVLPMVSCVWEAIQPLYVDQIDDSGSWISSLVVTGVKLVRMATGGQSSTEFDGELFDKSVIPSLRAQLETNNLDELLQTSNLELRCANADPNYGSMWFNCRNAPTDTARVILRRARDHIVADVRIYCYIYVAAIIRSCGIMAAAKHEGDLMNNSECKTQAAANVNAAMAELATVTPSIEAMLQLKTNETPDDTVLLESSASGFHFTSGLVVLNRHKSLLDMPMLQRKKILFGSDALFS